MRLGIFFFLGHSNPMTLASELAGINPGTPRATSLKLFFRDTRTFLILSVCATTEKLSPSRLSLTRTVSLAPLRLLLFRFSELTNTKNETQAAGTDYVFNLRASMRFFCEHTHRLLNRTQGREAFPCYPNLVSEKA